MLAYIISDNVHAGCQRLLAFTLPVNKTFNNSNPKLLRVRLLISPGTIDIVAMTFHHQQLADILLFPFETRNSFIVCHCFSPYAFAAKAITQQNN